MKSLNIFKKIEELIKEHGSASILRDHVNLLREQFSMLEKENAELKKRLAESEKKCKEHTETVAALTNELDSMKRCDIKHRMKWGCLVFEGDDNLYCPACFYERDRKILTSRKNIHYRYCPVCKSDIPTG